MRGAGKKGTSTCLTEIISDHDLDFIGLQETMKKNLILKVFFASLILITNSFGSGFLLLVNLGVFFLELVLTLWKFKLLSWGNLWFL